MYDVCVCSRTKRIDAKNHFLNSNSHFMQTVFLLLLLLLRRLFSSYFCQCSSINARIYVGMVFSHWFCTAYIRVNAIVYMPALFCCCSSSNNSRCCWQWKQKQDISNRQKIGRFENNQLKWFTVVESKGSSRSIEIYFRSFRPAKNRMQ